MSATFFYPTFTNVFFLIFSTFLRYFNFFFNFHLNVYYIYGMFDMDNGSFTKQGMCWNWERCKELNGAVMKSPVHAASLRCTGAA